MSGSSVAQPRAAIYTRVSSDQQEDNYSLPTQESACREYCERRGYQVVAVFREVWTGAQYRERPQLARLRQLVRQRAIDVVVALDVDRLTRDQSHLHRFLDELREHGVQLEFVAGSFSMDSVGKFTLTARAFGAEWWREKIRENSLRGRRARAQAGKHLGTAPVPLYGYRWRDADHSGYEPDPVTAPIVQKIFALALAGHGTTVIANELTRQGIPTPLGKSVWSLTTVWRILTNPAYIGKARAFAWEPTETGRSYRRKREGYIELPPGTIPPLIDEATFAAVQAQLARNRQRSARRNSAPELWLLRGGFAQCGICGGTMVARLIRGAPVYRCYNRTRHPAGIPKPEIRAAILDEAVWQAVRAVFERDDFLAFGQQALAQMDDPQPELEQIERVRERLRRQQANLARAIATAEHEDAVEPLVAELERVSASLRKLDEEAERVQEEVARWREARERLNDLLAWRRAVTTHLSQLDYAGKRWLLDLLGLRAVVYPEGPEWPERFEVKLEIPVAVDPNTVLQNKFAR